MSKLIIVLIKICDFQSNNLEFTHTKFYKNFDKNHHNKYTFKLCYL